MFSPQVLPKITAVKWLGNVIKSFKDRSERGELKYINSEIVLLEKVLHYVKKAPAYKKRR